MNTLLMAPTNMPLVNGTFMSGRLPPIFGFSRASPKYISDENGNLFYVSSNLPAFETWTNAGGVSCCFSYESQRTNMAVRSQTLSLWGNNAATSVTDNFYTSSSGVQNATQIVTEGTNRGCWLFVTGVTPSAYYAISGYVKGFAGVNSIRVGAETTEDVVGDGMITLDPTTGMITSFGPKTYDRYAVLLPNGWVYFRYRVKTGVAQTEIAYVAYSFGGGATYSLWGAQVEEVGASGHASSYIATEGAAVTRAADQLSAIIPAGVSALRVLFDDDSRQDMAVSPGPYIVPTTLNRSWIKEIRSL